MASFQHGAVEIAYFDEGEGDPILLVHGFASNKEVNWIYPGWTTALKGGRVIALDNRGHGGSSKLYDPADYHLRLMTEDARALLDHLGISRVDILGYSMGARIAAFLAHDHPARVRSAILGGIGSALLTGGLSENIADALEAPGLDQVTDPVGRAFRQFAEQTRSDLTALAACLRGSRQRMTPQEAGAIRVPVLIAVGSKDTVAGSPHELAKLIPGAQVLEIPNRDHMLAVGDRVYKDGVLRFLGEQP
jgi:pimeloyl-ACP methyl ester carboxylesterase